MATEDDLYRPWSIKGTYFSKMLHCGCRYNNWGQYALSCLPFDVLNQYKEKLAFVSTGESDGFRVARGICEGREIIVLSERILPKLGMNEGDSDVRYFTFAVLHEVAHAFMRHRSPMFDGITQEENEAQEEEADALALKWYNDYVRKNNNPLLPELTKEEVERAKAKNQAARDTAYRVSNEGLQSGPR